MAPKYGILEITGISLSNLSLSAATNILQACYQMAHETVHLLAPSGGRNANNFEEGVACYFAAYYMK